MYISNYYTVKTAKLGPEVQHGKNLGGEKELVSAYSLIVNTKTGPREIVTARFYMGRSNSASLVHCSVWISGPGFYTSGHGTAGGGGYDKQSAAFASALSDANVELFGPDKKRAYIGGVGESAIREALDAIARAMGFNGKNLLVTH